MNCIKILFIAALASVSLLQAAQRDLSLIATYLKEGGDANKEVEYISKKYLFDLTRKGLPLHIAVEFGDKDLALLALEKGADINLIDREGRSPLRVAVLENQPEMAKLLMENGVDKESKDSKTSLKTGVESGYIKLVNVLLNNNMDPNGTVDGSIPLLHDACTMGYFKVVKLLLEKGADINYVTHNYPSALLCTAEVVRDYKNGEKKNKYMSILDLLLKKGADVNKGARIENGVCTWNVLNAVFGNYEAMRLLLLHGVKPTKGFLSEIEGKISDLKWYVKELKDDEDKEDELLDAQNELRLCEEIDKLTKLQLIKEIVNVQQEKIGLLEEQIRLLRDDNFRSAFGS